MKNKAFYLLIAFLVLDTFFSFIQYLHLSLDGDLAGIVLPSAWYQTVLDDPLGISALTQGKEYAATNRFFAHFTLRSYFRSVPFFLQSFTNPINSLYISAAMAKILLHVFVVWLLATYIRLTLNLRLRDALVAAALVVPFFQGSEFYGQIGLVDKSVTYVFFYLLPISLLLLFFLPFYKAYTSGTAVKLTILQKVIWFCLVVYLSLHGPLIPVLFLLICPSILLTVWWGGIKAMPPNGNLITRSVRALGAIPGTLLFYFCLAIFLSLYSYYIGRFNAENAGPSTVSLIERYKLLPKGFAHHFYSVAAALIFFIMYLNFFLIRLLGQADNKVVKRLIAIAKWLAIFSIIYLLLLPLGGYRPYRPLIVRYDTFIPVTVCLVFITGITTMYVLRFLQFKARNFYIAGIVGILAVFTLSDYTYTDYYYRCEKDSLRKIAASELPVVELKDDCGVLSWGALHSPGESDVNGQMLHFWNVTKDKKQYHYKP